jgi:hypothetical protein
VRDRHGDHARTEIDHRLDEKVVHEAPPAESDLDCAIAQQE